MDNKSSVELKWWRGCGVLIILDLDIMWRVTFLLAPWPPVKMCHWIVLSLVFVCVTVKVFLFSRFGLNLSGMSLDICFQPSNLSFLGHCLKVPMPKKVWGRSTIIVVVIDPQCSALASSDHNCKVIGTLWHKLRK